MRIVTELQYGEDPNGDLTVDLNLNNLNSDPTIQLGQLTNITSVFLPTMYFYLFAISKVSVAPSYSLWLIPVLNAAVPLFTGNTSVNITKIVVTPHGSSSKN